MIKYVLEQLYSFEAARGTLDLSLDLIYKYISSQLDADNFEECNQFFQSIDLTKIRPTLAINMLAITIAYKANLEYWNDFLEKVRRQLTLQYGIKKAEILLRGIA